MSDLIIGKNPSGSWFKPTSTIVKGNVCHLVGDITVRGKGGGELACDVTFEIPANITSVRLNSTPRKGMLIYFRETKMLYSIN